MELSKKNLQSVFFFAFTELFTSIVMLFLLHLQNLQIQFVLTEQFSFEKIFKIWSVMAKGQGVPFSTVQGLISDKSTSSAHRSVRDGLGYIPSAS